ncbi:FG-GAP-like repeat-containing protein [Streptomyces sp. NPDC093225]|uniref:FG-GAP-like repeat-containing protein n=1 Tax=Streptomyces sp. NPDC093225 TaxID=3366034 RepID=UPI0037F7DAE4
MRRSFTVRSRRSLATLVALAAVAGAAPVLAGQPAAAAGLGPWVATKTLASALTDPQDLVVTGNGTTVALWNQKASVDAPERKLFAEAMPAGQGYYTGPAKLLATTPTEVGDASLAVAGDDKVVATWTEFPENTDPGEDGKTAGRIMSATLTGSYTWSAPQPVLGTDRNRYVLDLDTAAAADGRVLAVWADRAVDSSQWEVWSALRGTDGTWSEPVQVSAAEADGQRATAPEAAFDAKGTAVIAYRQEGSWGADPSIRTVTRAAGATAWSAPKPVVAAATVSGLPRLAAGTDGSVGLTWTERADEGAAPVVHTATTPDAAAAGWSTGKPLPVGDSLTETPEPLIEPDGDLTLVWVDAAGGFGTRTATRAKATGAWTAVKTLSTQYVPEQFDAAIGRDGSIRVLWTQDNAAGTSRYVWSAGRSDDTWTTSAVIQNSGTQYAVPQVAVGAKGQGGAVWAGARSDSDPSLFYSFTTAYVPPLAVASATVPATIALAGTTSTSKAWTPVWQLNRPVSSWTLTVTGTDGKVLRTLTSARGAAASQTVAPAWTGRTTDGAVTPNGPVKWTLTGVAEGETATVNLASGSATVTGGGALFRDYGSATGSPDGTGDALVLTTNGGLRSIYGDRATGAFKGTATGYGWPAGTLPVPMKDMNGDRCNDLVVRNKAGELRRYTPACGKTATPGTTNKLIGGGWNVYDVLTSPGDVTGDGRADLIARNPANGYLYVYARTSAGVFAPRVQIPGVYKHYKRMVGAGDLNGDGNGDLFVQDTYNNAWIMFGIGGGRFGTPDYVGAKWGATYNAVVAAGDMNGDNKGDLLARDTSGAVWRIPGTTTGVGFKLGAPVKIATGWQVYAGLY